MSQEYEYKPLTKPDSIRLIDLKPSLVHNGEIRCSLVHTTLSSGDRCDIFYHYTAVSYVWGSPQKFETIWVDEKPLKVTSSLFSALRDLRDEQRPFLLWADGICINQTNNRGKGVQVQMMGCIYAEASNTIIYFGPHLLTAKEWFSRVWIFQELVFAKDPWMQCGRTRAKWNVMVEKGLHFAPERQRKIVSEMQRAWSNHHSSHDETSLLQLVQARRGLGVSDPRDMVFAHVGFAIDADNWAIDYSKTCAQVFVDFAMQTAITHGLMAVLDLTLDFEVQSRLRGLPSFVPNLGASLSPILRFPNSTTVGSNNCTPWRWTTGENLVFLMSAYEKLSSLTSCEVLLSQIPPADQYKIASELANIKYTNHSNRFEIHPKDIPILEAVWDRIAHTWGENIGYSDIPLLDLFPTKRRHHKSSFLEHSIPLYAIMSFDKRFNWNYLNGRALAISDQGKFALVPATSQRDDLLALLALSSNSPVFGEVSLGKLFVFRPVNPVAIDTGRFKAMALLLWHSPLDDSILHCEMIGEAFMQNDARGSWPTTRSTPAVLY